MKLVCDYMGKRTRWARAIGLCSVFLVGYVCPMYFNLGWIFRNSHPANGIPRLKQDFIFDESQPHVLHVRHLLQTDATTEEQTTPRPTNSSGGIYPPDIFTDAQKKQGAVILHVILMIYMFVALAIVCDEFFVPSLGVITDRLSLSDDVAGATFMAAGGSTPELFTSIIGVFLARNNVGIGTIVGSAVFNILFVIGMCATFSRGVLTLTWWPLFRDCLFYTISMALLIVFFNDQTIHWYESLCLLLMYFLYVLFMKFNMVIERWVKSQLLRKKVSAVKQNNRRVSLPHFRNNASVFRHGALQLMLHTLDPLSETDFAVDDKAIQMQSIAKMKRSSVVHPMGNGKDLPSDHAQTEQTSSRSDSARSNQKLTITYHNGYANGDLVPDDATQITTVSQSLDSPATQTANGFPINTKRLNGEHFHVVDKPGESDTDAKLDDQNGGLVGQNEVTRNSNIAQVQAIDVTNNGMNGGTPAIANGVDPSVEKSTEQLATPSTENVDAETGDGPVDQPDIANMEVEDPLDISWPAGWRKRVTYVLLAPLVFSLWITLPDVRRPTSQKWYPWTFTGSMLWIALFSYLMVWMANEVGTTIGIKDEVMGLTFLAAGTSIPDLITSVIVARKGLGDMAVSSSVGSNIFDITVGLPFPWILYSIINSGKAINVNSKGLFCSILLLFGMLILVVVTIAANKWRMTKLLGACMFGLYVVFLTFSILLTLDILNCPVGA